MDSKNKLKKYLKSNTAASWFNYRSIWRLTGQVWRHLGALWRRFGQQWRRFGAVWQHKNNKKPHFQLINEDFTTNSRKFVTRMDWERDRLGRM